jgi:hypothetical protein
MDGMSPLLLDEYDHLPDALATVSARDLRTVFPNSALIRLEGRRRQPLALGVMLHGDEVVGLAVLKRLQAWMKDHPLPRSLLIFVGNVFAAEAGVRKLPDGRIIIASGMAGRSRNMRWVSRCSPPSMRPGPSPISTCTTIPAPTRIIAACTMSGPIRSSWPVF